MSPAVADLATLLENASLKILVKILPLLKYTVVQTSHLINRLITQINGKIFQGSFDLPD